MNAISLNINSCLKAVQQEFVQSLPTEDQGYGSYLLPEEKQKNQEQQRSVEYSMQKRDVQIRMQYQSYQQYDNMQYQNMPNDSPSFLNQAQAQGFSVNVNVNSNNLMPQGIAQPVLGADGNWYMPMQPVYPMGMPMYQHDAHMQPHDNYQQPPHNSVQRPPPSQRYLTTKPSALKKRAWGSKLPPGSKSNPTKFDD